MTGEITLTESFIERGGVPWVPVMGEYHFSRDDESRWKRELQKMRAGGVTIVSTYMLWILHEEIRGKVRWDGRRNIRRFVELAQEADLKVILRIGPWAHGEARNGGFPDWLQALPVRHRTNDPEYLELATGWFEAIAGQLSGLFYSPNDTDAPIVGIQIENELYDQPEHLDTLKAMAERTGMSAALWVATGWGGAQLPDTLMPVYAGYSDGFWEEAETGWPAFGRLHFTFSTVRDDLSVGADLRTDTPVATRADDRFPYATCELGGGMQTAYHRRPLVDSVDISALALTKLGSGSVWQGYYLYHGSTQTPGQLSTTQESHATGYPNDLPLVDYDFFAPIGAHGQLREHYHLLRQQHLLLERYGEALATYRTAIPARVTASPRWSVRTDGVRGFLFVNNHQPHAERLGALENVQFDLHSVGLTAKLPRAPITLEAGARFLWPIRQPMGSIPSVTGTIQPITEISTGDGYLVVVAATAGIPVELEVDGVTIEGITGATATVSESGAVRLIPAAPPGPESRVKVGSTTIVILDPVSAARVWRGAVNGTDSVLIWDHAATFGSQASLHPSLPHSTLLIVPGPGTWSDARVASLGRTGVFGTFDVAGPHGVDDCVVVPVREAVGTRAAQRGGPLNRLSAPVDRDFDRAATFALALPEGTFDGAERVLVSLDWRGDVARVLVDGALVADQFYSGRALDFDITAFAGRSVPDIEVQILPWQGASTVHMDTRARPDRDGAFLHRARLIRESTVPLASTRIPGHGR